MSESNWQCPRKSKTPAAKWVAKQNPPPIEEHRKLTRPVFEWFDIEEVDFSVVDDDVEEGLKARGLYPRCRYKTKDAFAIAGYSDESHALWEYWCSEDGITTATVMIAAAKSIGFETRFVGPKILASNDGPATSPKPFVEYLPHDGDALARYDAHRARVRERIEDDGEIALSMKRDKDRDAFWLYYADHLAGEDLAEGIKALQSVGNVGWFSWGCAGIAIALLALVVGGLSLVGLNFRTLVEWFGLWWPIVFLVVAPGALMRWAVAVFKAQMNHLDHKYPDALEEHAGYWLKGRIREEGLEGKVEVGKAKEALLSDLDAYLPFRKKIVLGHKTYDKQDPTFWAIAAHELGHAVDYHRRAVLAPVSTVSRVLFQRFMGWIYGALLLNTLFGWSAANEGIYWLLVATLIVGGIVLIDEAIASMIGMRILRSDDRITDEMARDMRRHLGAAFATYCSPLVVYAGMLAGWGTISEYILSNASFTPAEPLIPGRVGIANVLSVLLAGYLALGAGRSIAKMVRSEEAETVEDEAEPGEEASADDQPKDVDINMKKVGAGCLAIVAYLFLNAAFALEVWDQPLGDTFRAAVFLFSPMIAFLFAPVTLPVSLLLAAPTWIARKLGLMPEAPDETPVARAKHAANDIVSEIEVLDPRQQLPWYVSAASPGPLLHALPLLVLWWLAQA